MNKDRLTKERRSSAPRPSDGRCRILEANCFAEFARKLAELERTQQLHGEDIQMILAAVRQLEETSKWGFPGWAAADWFSAVR